MPRIPAPSVSSSVPSMSQRISELFMKKTRAGTSIPRSRPLDESEVAEHTRRNAEVGNFRRSFGAGADAGHRIHSFVRHMTGERNVGYRPDHEGKVRNRRDDQLGIERDGTSADGCGPGRSCHTRRLLVGSEISYPSARPNRDRRGEAQGIADAGIDDEAIARGGIGRGGHTVFAYLGLARSMQISDRPAERQTGNNGIVES